MSDIDEVIAFYRAQLDEVEQAARALAEFPTPWAVDIAVIAGRGGRLAVISDGSEGKVLCDFHKGDRPLAEHIARQDPARVLRRVASGRALIRMYEEAVERIEMLAGHGNPAKGSTVAAESYANAIRLEAAVWDDHEDWKPGWRTGWMDEVLGEPLPYRAENET